VTVKVTFEFETTQEFLDFFSSINQESTVKIELPAKVEPQVDTLLPEVEQAKPKKAKKPKKPKKDKKPKKAKKAEKADDSEKEERNAVKEWKKKYVSESVPLATPLDEEWQKLFDQGYSVKIAAELLNKGKGSAYHWARKFGKKWPRVSKVDKLHELQSKIAREIVSPPKEVKPTLTPPVKPKKPTREEHRNKQFSLVYDWLAKEISGGRVSTDSILAEMRVPDQDIELATEICVELMEAACSMYPNDWACVTHPSDSGVTITTLLSFNLQAKLPSLEELRQH